MPLLDYIEFEVHMGYSGLDAKQTLGAMGRGIKKEVLNGGKIFANKGYQR